jgi:hypothetical protein
MRKPFNILASLGVAAVFLSASPAWADHEGVPVYRTYMYSDASKTTLVGTIEFRSCLYYAQSDSVQYGLEGTYTNYQETELIGWCSERNFGPIHEASARSSHVPFGFAGSAAALEALAVGGDRNLVLEAEAAHRATTGNWWRRCAPPSPPL